MPPEYKLSPILHCGTLTDAEIKYATDQGWLIQKEFEPENLMAACYELRASNIYYELDQLTANKIPRRVEIGIGTDEFILIKPKQTVVIITMESLLLPPDFIGRVLTKGKFFMLGIAPVNTYADPGFEGRMGIVFTNLSNNYIKIPQGQAISKIEFSKLRRPVDRPYVGAHGFHSDLWAFPNELILGEEDLKKDNRIRTPIEEIEASHGKVLGELSRRMFKYEKWLILVGIVYFVLIILIIGWWTAKNEANQLANLVTFSVGIAASLIASLITIYATKLSNR